MTVNLGEVEARLDELSAQLDVSTMSGRDDSDGDRDGFEQLVALVNDFNAAAAALDAPTDEAEKGRIARLVGKFRDVAAKVARATNARSFTISVGFPVGVMISIEWSRDT